MKIETIFFKAIQENRNEDALSVCTATPRIRAYAARPGIMKFGSSSICNLYGQAAAFEIHALNGV